jgi:hypothetical protein
MFKCASSWWFCLEQKRPDADAEHFVEQNVRKNTFLHQIYFCKAPFLTRSKTQHQPRR